MRKWLVMAGCCIGQGVGTGALLITSFGVYMVPMTRALGWNRMQFSSLFTTFSIAIGVMMLFGGHVIKRFGARKLLWIAMIAAPASYALFGLVSSYYAAILIAILVGLTGMYNGNLVYFAILTKWFNRHLGAALGVGAGGNSLGSIGLPLAATFFMARSNWRWAFLMIAIMVMAIALLDNALLIRENKGPMPETERRDTGTFDDTKSGIAFRDAIRSGAFWSFTLAFSIIILISMGVNLHIAAMLRDRGYSPMQAASAIGAVGSAAVVARVGGGVLLDYVQMRYLALIFFGAQGVAALLLRSGAGGATPWIACILLGCALGLDGDLLAYTIRRRFGLRDYAPIYATGYAIYNFTQALGPLLLGVVYDRAGSYRPVLTFLPVLSVLAIVLVFIPKLEPAAGLQPAKAASS